MEHKIITGSITHATRGRDILRTKGYKANIERKVSENKSGCGYAVVFDGDLEKALDLFRKADVKILKVI